METTLLFTFWGLNVIREDTPIKTKGFLGKMMGDKGVASLEELLQTAIDLDVHLLACKMSMDVLEISRDDLIPEVENVVGVATMVKEAAKSKIQLFI